MKRILVIGCSGGGKSTIARAIGSRLNLPVVHLDWHYWRPGWVRPDEGDWQVQAIELAARESWVMDGTFPSSLPMRLDRAHAVVWVDRGRVLCLWRALKRLVGDYGRNRPDLAPGCSESFDPEFLRYILTFREVQQPLIEQALSQQPHLPVFRLRNEREVALFLAEL